MKRFLRLLVLGVAVAITARAQTVVITGPSSPVNVAAGTITTTGTVSPSAAVSVTVTNSVTGIAVVTSAAATVTGTTWSLAWTPPAVGTYSIRAVDGSAFSTTTLVINSIAPTITLALTGGGTSIPAGSARYLAATATDDGAITKVEFYFDGALLGTVSTPGSGSIYSLAFTAPSVTGTHQLSAIAYDNSGNTTATPVTPIEITAPVGSAPTAGMSTPSSGVFLPVGVATTITGTAANADGTTSTVVVFMNGVNLGNATVTAGTWSLAWTPTLQGVVSLSTIVTDDRGNAVLAPAVAVNVTDNTSPVVTLSLSPNTSTVAASTTLPAGATRNIVVNATPATGRAIVRVEFFINGTKVGEDNIAPYTYRYTAPTATGQYVFSARATDNTGLARDAQLTFTISSAVGLPPTVNVLTPTNGTSVVPNTAVSLAAAAFATGGTISNVQFYVNGNPANVNSGNGLTAAPYIAQFTPTAPGTYVIDAIATDDRANTTISNSVTITAAFGTPTIAITSPSGTTTRATPNVPLTITATAQGGSGAAVLLVEFLLDGVQIGTKTAPTVTGGSIYSFAWTPTTAQLGAHLLTARVTDTNSLTVTSAPAITVTVANVVGTPPTVTITAPAAAGTAGSTASTLQTLSTVNFVANAFASGTGNTLSSVEFFLNGTSAGLAAREQTTNTFRLAYNFGNYDFTQITPVINGITGATTFPLSLYAIAKDSSGNQTISATVNLTLTTSSSAPPTVGLTSLGLPSVAQGTAFLMTATPADSDGTVTTMQLYVNGAASGAAIVNPPAQTTVTYTPTAAGNYNLYVVATDDTLNTAISTPSIVLNVTATNPPNTALITPADDSTVTTIGAPVFLVATASGSNITQIPTVSFIATGSGGARTTIAATRVGTTTTYRATWTPIAADTYTIVSSATLGTVSANSTVSHRVLVNNVVGFAPVVSGLVFPATATSASTAVLSATATSASSSIVSVEFFVNLASVGLGTRAQQTNLWSIATNFGSLAAGSYPIVAIALDASGNYAPSATGTMTITAATTAAPTVSIAASPTTVAFSQPVQLSANAISATGTVSSVQYFANGASVGTSTAAPLFTLNLTPTLSGTYSVYGVATDNTGNTAVSPTIQVTVMPNNPILVTDAFILQTYTDITNAAPSSVQLAAYDAQFAAGTLTRSQLVSTLATGNTNFGNIVNALAAYYVIMGQWPTTANYTTLFNQRGNLAAACGTILASPEHFVKYGATPTAATLNASYATFTTFATTLWQNAGLGTPSTLQLFQFQNNDTAVATLGRGYAALDVNSTATPQTPVGINQSLAEFVTLTNSTNTALLKLATAAALYYQLDKPAVVAPLDPAAGTGVNTTTTAVAARIQAIAALADLPTMADAVLKDVLYTYRFVTITGQPQSLTVAAKSGALFRVVATGQPPLSYQWLFNGVPIGGATSPLLSLTNLSSANTGNYTVSITSAVASAVSSPATLTLSTALTKLGNISTRGTTGAGGAQSLIAGFVVTGPANQTRQMLIRVIGPGLAAAPFNVSGFLADPRLEVYGSASSSVPILTNDNWGTQTGGAAAVTAIQQAATRSGAFALTNTASLDAAVLATLAPGSYTVQAKGPNTSGTGIVLIEVYDATPTSTATTPKPINVSTRGTVGTGANTMIAGFVISGTVSRRILIRGVGPTLANFGLAGAGLLATPQIELFDSNNVSLRANSNWASGDDAAVIAAASTAAGAFPLTNGSRDAAMLLMLAPGGYTVQLTGVSNTTGLGLVEVYDVDP